MKLTRTFSKHKETTYTARPVDKEGYADFSDEEHQVWSTLYTRQIEAIKDRACRQFIDGLDILGMSPDHIPQIPDLNKPLLETSGWQVEPVAALISSEEFFTLLANKKFPAATFIRRPDELDYLQEPDLFHEYFGHCPLLTVQAYADFSQRYGELALKANNEQREFLARLYWYTIEFGLVRTDEGLRIYGGGILSSPGETVYSLESDEPERRSMDPVTAMRTPHRIDMMQSVYYVLERAGQLYELLDQNIEQNIKQAQELGDFEPTFPVDDLI